MSETAHTHDELAYLAGLAVVRSDGFDRTSPALAREVIALRAQVEKLQAFKDYVHERLDQAGVPADPESPHKAAGCRIGGRLDAVLVIMPGQVEAAAAAAWNLHANRDWSAIPESWKPFYRECARAALDAARSA